MIPYELIIPSASRPHLLGRVLESLVTHLDTPPERLLIHDDAVFPGKQGEVGEVVGRIAEQWGIPPVVLYDSPPIFHGPALQRLLAQVRTPYVLYSQDDHVAVRTIPVAPALDVLDQNRLHQIRFNKRDTMDKKGREGAEFHKVEYEFERVWARGRAWGSRPEHGVVVKHTCCAADHWYFQTGVWRVAAIKPVVDWWDGPGRAHGAFTEHMEVKINQVFNGQWQGKHPAFPPEVPILEDPTLWNVPAIRAGIHKTFIWGPVGEPAYVQHIGHLPEDWALKRDNRDKPQ